MNIALVLSGGVGSRIRSDVPKQYIPVRGKMIATYTLHALCSHRMIDAIWVVADKPWQDPILSALENTKKIKGFSLPGENRQLSILNGLRDMKDYAADEDVVFIHDIARPCISEELIMETIKAVRGHEGAVPVLPLKDTVYYSEDGERLSGRLERAKILAGQAPEAFLYGRYMAANDALTKEELLKISGSAEPALMAGMDIATLPGDEKNFKITTNEDLERFRRLVEGRE